MKILFYIAVVLFSICAVFFFTSICAIIGIKKRKKYTQKGEATLLRVGQTHGRDADWWYEISYTVDGVAHEVNVGHEYAEGVSIKTPAGTRLPIWYDPDNPGQVIITEDPTMRKTVESWRRTRKRSFIWMLIFLGIMVPTFPKDETQTGLARNVTTIGQFSQELSALAEKTPDKLIFTESIGAPDTFCITIEDPGEAKKVLNTILNAQVSKVGCQVDMAQYRFEKYCFVFGEETFTFGFLPHSYFCYNGNDYELGENRISAVCDSLHAMAAETGTGVGEMVITD